MYFQIRSELFTPIQRLDHYEIYRDGFCLWVKNNRTREGFLIKHVDIKPMLMEIMHFPALFLVADHLVEAVLTSDRNYTIYAMPTDERIIQYCIDKAFIPHPFEIYGQ